MPAKTSALPKGLGLVKELVVVAPFGKPHEAVETHASSFDRAEQEKRQHSLGSKPAVITQETGIILARQGLFWPHYTDFSVGGPSIKGSNRCVLSYLLVRAMPLFSRWFPPPPSNNRLTLRVLQWRMPRENGGQAHPPPLPLRQTKRRGVGSSPVQQHSAGRHSSRPWVKSLTGRRRRRAP